MELILRRYGNSTVLALPPAVLRALGWKAGQAMALQLTSNGGITLMPRPRHQLSELLAQCNGTATPPDDVWPWSMVHGKAQGLAHETA